MISIEMPQSGKVLHRHVYADWSVDSVNHSGVCLTCGETETGAHKWDTGVVIKDSNNVDTNEKLFTCTICETTRKAKIINSLPAEYTAYDFRLPLADYGSGDTVVADPDSKYGMAVCISYEKRVKYNPQGLSSTGLIRTPGQYLKLYTDTAILIGEWSSAQLQENSAGGKYVEYVFKNVNITGANYMYLFECWGFQIPMEILGDAFDNKNVDVTVSMKITGDVTTTEGNTPCYYIDYISITESEPIPEHEHEYGEWTTDVLSHKATCKICSMKLEGLHVWDDGVVKKEATDTEDGEIVYTCKVCGMEDTKKIKAKPSVNNGVASGSKPASVGLIIGCSVAGVLAVAIAVVAVRLVIKKKGKRNKDQVLPG